MKLPLKALAAFAASPQGRRAIQNARTRIDTPENRKRVTDAVSRIRSRGQRPQESTARPT
jgi:hypothetical protein